LRYFRSKKQTGLISFTSYVSIIGIALGAFALLVTLSILNGFESEISSRVIDLESHIRVTGKDITDVEFKEIISLLQPYNVNTIYPFVIKKSVLSTLNADAVVRLKGIDSKIFTEKIINEKVLIRGNNTFLAPTSDLPGIVVGYRLADKLGLYLGDTINVVNPLDIKSAFSIPYVGRFVLCGVFKLDLFDYDDNLAFVDIKEAQKIFKLDSHYSGIDIRFDNYKHISQIKAVLLDNLGSGFEVMSWEDLHKDLFGAMKLEKYGSFLALSFIILIAIFNLTSSLVMQVMEKIREIGMMLTLGMNRKQIGGIFLRMGFITGSLGLSVGLLLSLLLCLLQQYFRFIPLPSVYIIPYLPVQVHFLDVMVIAVSGLILIYFGSFYPSWRVSKLAPLEAIQYEK